jgi:hypothetical protein
MIELAIAISSLSIGITVIGGGPSAANVAENTELMSCRFEPCHRNYVNL